MKQGFKESPSFDSTTERRTFNFMHLAIGRYEKLYSRTIALAMQEGIVIFPPNTDSYVVIPVDVA